VKVRSLVSAFAWALVAAALAHTRIVAQPPQRIEIARKDPAPKLWTPSLMHDGHPDLQGNWVNRSATPLERPKQLQGRRFLTDAEVAELRKRADRLFKDPRNDFAQVFGRDDVFLAALENREQYKNPNTTGSADEMVPFEFDNRTSLLIDPADGRLPDYTPAGQRRWTALQAAAVMLNPAASAKDLTSIQRCITWGVPMPRPGPYTSYYQILQSPGYVVVVMEAIQGARIIPLHRRQHLPQNMRAWNGDSIGRWEGQTLVVDTANFSSQSNFLGSAENLHLIERFTRVAPDEIRYQITIDDATTWTKPWTAVLRLKQTPEKLYEFACHEGNFPVMQGMLLGARAQENASKEAAAKR
jgi:hypothetical protein